MNLQAAFLFHCEKAYLFIAYIYTSGSETKKQQHETNQTHLISEFLLGYLIWILGICAEKKESARRFNWKINLPSFTNCVQIGSHLCLFESQR